VHGPEASHTISSHHSGSALSLRSILSGLCVRVDQAPSLPAGARISQSSSPGEAKSLMTSTRTMQPDNRTASSPTLKWLAIAAILGTGLIHLVEAQDAFGDARYKGVLFVANGVGALVAAFGLHRNRRVLGWYLGL